MWSVQTKQTLLKVAENAKSLIVYTNLQLHKEAALTSPNTDKSAQVRSV